MAKSKLPGATGESAQEQIERMKQAKGTLEEFIAANVKLSQELQSVTQQSSAFFQLAAEGASRAAETMKDLDSSSSATSQNIEGLSKAIEKQGKALEKANKEAGFKKGGDGRNNVFEQMAKSSKAAKVGITLLSGAFNLLGKAIKGVVSIVGGIFDVFTSILGAIPALIGGFLNFGKSIFDSMVQGSEEVRQFSFEVRKALERVKEKFGDTSKGAASDIKSFVATAVGMYNRFGDSIFASADDAANFALELAGTGEMATILSDQLKESSTEIIKFAKGLGTTGEESTALMNMAYSSGTDLVEIYKDIGQFSQGMASRLGLNAKVLSKNIQIAAKDVKHFGKATVQAMSESAAYAAKMGVSLDKIVGVLDKFDTFEDAANNVSKLSQAFGVNLDTMKLVEAETPEERLEMLKDSFNAAGKSLDNLSRRELNYASSLIGLDEAATKNLLSNENQKNSLNDVKDASVAVADEMKSMGDVLKQVTKDIAMNLKQLTRETKGFFDTFVDGILTGIERTPEMQKIFMNISAALDAVFIAGNKLGAAFVHAFPGVKKMLDALGQFFNPKMIGDMFNGFTRSFENFFKSLGTGTGDVRELFNDLYKNLTDYFTSQGPAGSQFLQGLTEFWNGIKQIIATAILGLGDLIADGLSYIADLLEGKKSVNTSSITEAAKKGMKKVEEEFSPISSAFEKSLEKMKPAFDRILNEISKRLDEWWKKTKKQISDWWEKFDLWEAIKNNPTASTLLSFFVLGKVLNAASTISNIASIFGKGLGTAVEGAGGFASKIASSAGPFVKQFSSRMVTALVATGPVGAALAGTAAVIVGAFYAGSKSLMTTAEKIEEKQKYAKIMAEYEEKKKTDPAEARKFLKEQLEVYKKALSEEQSGFGEGVRQFFTLGLDSESQQELKARMAAMAAQIGDSFDDPLKTAGQNAVDKANDQINDTFKKIQQRAKENNLDLQFEYGINLEGEEGLKQVERTIKDLQQQMIENMYGDDAQRRQATFARGQLNKLLKAAGATKFSTTGGVDEALDPVSKLLEDLKQAKLKVKQEKSEIDSKKAEIDRKKAEEAGKKMMEETINEMGLTTVDNVEERIKKIEEIGAKISGGKEQFKKNMEKIRADLKDYNFSLFDKPEDKDKFAAMLGDSTTILTFMQTMDKVFVSMQNFGNKAAGIGSEADEKSIIGSFMSGLRKLKTGFKDVKASLEGGTTSTGISTKGFVKGMEENAYSESFKKAEQEIKKIESPLANFSASFISIVKSFETMSVLKQTDISSVMNAFAENLKKFSRSVDMIADSVNTERIEDLRTKITAIKSLQSDLNDLMPEKVTLNATPTTASTAVPLQSSTKVANPRQGLQINMKFDIVMDAKALEKTLVTRKDSIVVKALQDGFGNTRTIYSVPDQGIVVNQGTTSPAGTRGP